jgi:hypothetical protein
MPEMTDSGAPWRLLLICALVSLVFPILYYWHAYSGLRVISASSRQLIEASSTRPMLAAEIKRSSDLYDFAMRRILVRSFLGDVVVSVGLAILTCWLISRRQGQGRDGLTGRILTDVGFVAAFVLAPWLAAAATYLGPPRENPISVWILGGFFPNALPCLAALSSALVFYLMSRRGRQLGEVA